MIDRHAVTSYHDHWRCNDRSFTIKQTEMEDCMHHHPRMVCFALCSVLAVWAAPAYATHTWDCLHVEPPTWEEYIGDEIQIPIGLEFYSTPVPAGDFYSYAYPSWGGLDTGTIVILSSTWTSYTSYINYVDIPTSPRSYTIRFVCIVEWSTGALEQQEFTSTITVLANPSTDLVVIGHSFDDPATVGTQTCGLVRFRNTGDGTMEIAMVDLDDNGVAVTWGDDTEATDFTLTASEAEWVGDPFCFTPNGAGTLTVDVDITLTNGDIFRDVDFFTITVRSSPCDGVTCSDTCSGDSRGYSGVPTVVGTTCECRYSWEDCNTHNTTGPIVEYCSAASDIRSHRSYTDYTCSGTSCVAGAPTWTSDQLVQDCTKGCVMASATDAVCPCETMTCTDLCEAGNIRRSGRIPTISGTSCVCSSGTTYDCDLSDTSPVRNEYCATRDRRYLDTWMDFACLSGACSGTAQSSDGFIMACTYACADSGVTTSCTSQPCTLVSVSWSATTATEGDAVSFSISHDGTCDATTCPTYTIIERDPWPNPDDVTASGSVCLATDPKTVSWTTTHDDAEVGSSEYDVLVDLGAQHIETLTALAVADRDPCAGVTCANACAGATREYNGVPTRSGDTCPCVYATEECDARDRTDPAEQYCMAGDELWSRQKHTNYSCTPSACVPSESWINDARVEDCDSRDNTTAAVSYCRTEDQRWSHAWRQDFICRTDACAIGTEGWMSETLLEDCDAYDTPITTVEYCWDTDGDGALEARRAFDTNEDFACADGACAANVTTLLNDRGIESCAYQCSQTTDTMTACILEPCTLISVEWEDEDGIVRGGIETSYTLTATGVCTAADRATIEIFEDDPLSSWPFEDDSVFLGSVPFEMGMSTTVGWTPDVAVDGDDEYYVLATLNDHSMRTSTLLHVPDLHCADLPCPDQCLGSRRFFDGMGIPSIRTASGCECAYPTEEDCDIYDSLDAPTTFCEGLTLVTERYGDFDCVAGACVADRTIPVERTTVPCPYGCAASVCLPCVSDWQCGPWSSPECTTPTRIRTCEDVHGCDATHVSREETETCGCEITDIQWTSTEVYDNEPVTLVTTAQGACDDACFDYRIRETDWAFIPDDTEWSGTDVCFSDEHRVEIPWIAHYRTDDAFFDSFADVLFGDHVEFEFGPNEYRGSVELNGRTWDSPLLVVYAQQLLIMDARGYLASQVAFTIPEATIERCFLNDRADDEPLQPDCIEWAHALGDEIISTEEIEDTLTAIFVSVVGDEELQIAAFVTCTACAVGEAAGLILACPPSGLASCFALAPVETATCGVLCGGVLDARLIALGRATWKSILATRMMTSLTEHIGATGLRTVRAAATDSVSYVHIADDVNSVSYDLVVARTGGETFSAKALRNPLQHIGNGGNVQAYLTRLNNRAEAKVAWYDGPGIAGRGALDTLAHLGDDDLLRISMDEDIVQLFDGEELHDVVTAFTFVDDIPSPSDRALLGLTTYDDVAPTSTIQINVPLAKQAFDEEAPYVLTHYVIPHELAHAAHQRKLFNRMYRPLPYGERDNHAIEFFTNAYRRIRAEGSIRSAEFTAGLETWVMGDYGYLSRTEQLGAVIRSYASATGELHGASLRLVELRAYAEEFNLPALRSAIERDVRGELGEAADDVLTRLGSDAQVLRDDATLFAAHVDDTGLHGDFDALVCSKYRIFSNCLTITGADIESGTTDGVPGPEDTTDEPTPYDPDDPTGPGHFAPSDGLDDTAPGTADGTGCACDARGGAHVPLLALGAIVIATRRRSRDRA